MDNFTPMDTLRAACSPFTSCFPSFSRSARHTTEGDERLGGRDELEGLLEDSADEGGRDADALSLRSEGGQRRRRQGASQRKGKAIQLCGLELFGRRQRTRGDELLDELDDTPEQDGSHLAPPAGGRQPRRQPAPNAQPWQRHTPALSIGTLSLPDDETNDAPALTPADIARLAATHFQPEAPSRPLTDHEAFGAAPAREDEFGDFVAPTSPVPLSQPAALPVEQPTPVSPKPRGETEPDEDDPEGDFGSLYARSSRRSRRGDGEGSSSTPSLSSRTSRSRAAPPSQRAAKRQGPASESSRADSVRTPTAVDGGARENGFEGWIGSGEGGDLKPVAGEGFPSTGLTRTGRR